MKKPIWVLFFLLYFLSSDINLYAQKKDTSDYFAIGIYGGAFNGQSQLYESDEILNSASVEIEYFKLENLSFYLQGLYKFEGSNYGYRRPPPPPIQPDNPYEKNIHNSGISILNISFGGRYYLRNKDINPFFLLGVNQLNYFSEYQNDQPDSLDYRG